MDLDKLYAERKRQHTAWKPFRHGMEVQVAYCPPSELQAILATCKRIEYRKHQPVQSYDDDLFGKKLLRFVLDWRGLTMGVLAKLVPIDVHDDEADTPVPCTDTNKAFLVRECYGFANFLTDTVTELAEVGQQQLDDEKKT